MTTYLITPTEVSTLMRASARYLLHSDIHDTTITQREGAHEMECPYATQSPSQQTGRFAGGREPKNPITTFLTTVPLTAHRLPPNGRSAQPNLSGLLALCRSAVFSHYFPSVAMTFYVTQQYWRAAKVSSRSGQWCTSTSAFVSTDYGGIRVPVRHDRGRS